MISALNNQAHVDAATSQLHILAAQLAMLESLRRNGQRTARHQALCRDLGRRLTLLRRRLDHLAAAGAAANPAACVRLNATHRDLSRRLLLALAEFSPPDPFDTADKAPKTGDRGRHK